MALVVAESAATFDLLTKTMGFRQVGREGMRTRFETGSAAGSDAILDVIESPEGPVGEESVGTVHHVAWRAPDDAAQKQWREMLVAAGRNVTEVIDR